MPRKRKTQGSIPEFDSRLEAAVGQMITYRLLAQDAVKILRPKCKQLIDKDCRSLIEAQTAEVVWESAIKLLAPLLRKGGRA